MGSLDLKFGVLGGTSLKEGTSGGDILHTLGDICTKIDAEKSLKVKISAVLDDKVAGNIAKQIKDAEKAADDVAQKRKSKEASSETKKFRELERQYALHKKRLRDLDNQLERKNLSSKETEQYKKEAAHHARVMGGLKVQIAGYKEKLRLTKMISEIDMKADSSKAHILSGDLRRDSTEYLKLFKETTAIQQQLFSGDVGSDLLGKMSTDYVAKLERMRELYTGIAKDQKLLNDLLQKQALIAKDLDVKGAQVDYKQQQVAAKNAETLYKNIEASKLKYGVDERGEVIGTAARADVEAKKDVLKILEAQIADDQLLYELGQKKLAIDKEIAAQKEAASAKVDVAAQKKAADDALAIYKKYSEAKTKSLTAPTEGERSIYADEAKALKEKVELAKQDITDTNTRINLYKKMKDIQAERSVTVAAKAASEQSKATAKEASQAEKTLKEYASRYKEFKALQASIDRGERGEAKLSKDLLDAQEADLRGLRERAEEQGIINVLENEEKRIDQELLATGEKLAEQDRRRSANAKNFTSAYAKSVDFLQKYGTTLQRKAPKEYDEFSALTRSFKDKTFEGTSREAVDRVKELIANYTQAGYTVESFGEKVRRIFSDKYVYGVIAVAAMYARNLVREVYRNVQEIDNAMTQLSIVTGQTGGALEASFDRAANSAKKLGSSITDLLGSMETFARLGYDMDESQMLAEVATMMSKVAAVDIDEATTGLTSIIKGFQLDPEDAEYVGDVLSNIGKKYAVSAGELIEAFERSGAAFKATGTDFEKATALIAAGNAAVDFCRVA